MRRWAMLVVMLVGYSRIVCGQTKPEVLGSPDAFVVDMKLVPEKQLLIANLADNIQLWNYDTKTLINSWSTSQVIAIDYAYDKLVGVTKSGSIIVWSIPDGKETMQLLVSDSPLTCVSWIDAEYFVTGSDSGEILKISSESGKIASKVTTSEAITALAYGEENLLFAGDEKGFIKAYDAKEMRLENTIKAHKSWIRQIKVSDSGKSFVTVSDDGRFRTWKTGKDFRSIRNESLGNWILCTDYFDLPESSVEIKAFGKRNGNIVVTTKFGNYTADLHSLINSIGIIRSEQPTILLALGTYGEGIQLLNAKTMKIKSK